MADHDGHIIKAHNDRIGEKDHVIHNGDFCFRNSPGGKVGEGTTKKSHFYISQLNGWITFILGNHDKNNSLKTYIESIVVKWGGNKYFITHRPENANKLYPINFVGHVHCFTDDTEILTNDGWKTIENIDPIHNTAISLNKSTGLLEENVIEKMFVHEVNEDLYCYNNSLFVTKDHRLYVKNQHSKKYNMRTAKEIYKLKNSNFYMRSAGYMEKDGINLTNDQIRLIVWICADGNINLNRKNNFYRVKLSKPRKIKRFQTLLDRMNIKYSINKCKKEEYQNYTPYIFNLLNTKNTFLNLFFKSEKRLPDEFRNLTINQVDVMINEYAITDGTQYRKGRFQISTSKQKEANLLQEICILNGYSCSCARRESKDKNNNFVLSLIKDRIEILHNSKHLDKIRYSGKVWCLSVPLDTLIAKRNGHVYITGNSSWKFYRKRIDERYVDLINVGIDVWGYMPRKIEEILKEYHKWTKMRRYIGGVRKETELKYLTSWLDIEDNNEK